MKRKKIILGMAVCVVALASNLNYAHGGYGASIKDFRGGNGPNPPCTATDANGNPLECNKIAVETSQAVPCLMYQYTVRVTHHNCNNWTLCGSDGCGSGCDCYPICHCANGGNSVTLNYYFSSPNCAQAKAEADAFKEKMLLDNLNEVHEIQPYILTYVMTDVSAIECWDSQSTTCLAETELCPTLVAS